jgi:2,3-bisphosphoglycerate-independent phosphoglycerate mutase
MTNEIEKIDADGVTYWTSKSMVEWLMANTNETDIIVFRPTPITGEEETDVVLDFSVGAIEQEEFTHVISQHIESQLSLAEEQ